MRRLLICAFVALAAAVAVPPASAEGPATAGAEQSPGALGWSALNRFGGDADGDGLLDGPALWGSARLDVFPVLVRPSPQTCAADDATWTVDGKEAEVTLSDGPNCEGVLRVRGEDVAHTVVVRTDGRSEVARVKVEDRLVVALGDSVASGEGNPLGERRWLDPPCHRSAVAGFEQAARLLGLGLDQGPAGHSLTFVSLACSGARIGPGLLKPYGGVAPDGRQPDYPPQVDRLERLAASRHAPRGGPAVDAVLLNVGANDIGFSRIVTLCAISIEHCAGSLEAKVLADQAQLPDRYDRLGRRLGRAAPGAPVLIAEYFDPTHDAGGRFCGHSVGVTTRAEAQWAYETVLKPLNAEVEAAAVRNHWRLVSGIAADFERHGYCTSGAERWVRLITGSAARQGDFNGTMHPSAPGHAAIARRVVGPLAETLGLKAPPTPPEEAESRTPLEWVVTVAVAAAVPVLLLQHHWLLALGPLGTWPWLILATLLGSLVLAPLLLILWVAARLVLFWRPTWPADPASPNQAERPTLPGVAQLGARQLLGAGLGLVALIALTAFLSGLAGRTILWLRFWSSNLPADQAVDAVPADELVIAGSQALGIFAVLGLVAVGVAWLLDGKGQWVRETRRGLVAIGLAEVFLAVGLGDFRSEQAVQLIAGLVLAAAVLYFLVEVILGFKSELDESAPEEPLAKTVFTRIQGWATARLGDLLSLSRRTWCLLWKALPLAFLAVAVVASLSAEGPNRRFLVMLPLALGAILLVAPGGMASPGLAFRNPQTESLRAPRVALALTLLLCTMTLIARDEAWLALSAVIATVLGLLCLAVAAVSGWRFAPYGLAVLVSVPLFGAAATILRGVDSPELQPAAVLLSGGQAVCGAYVGESDDKLWLAQVELDERGDVRRPRRGVVFSIPSERVVARAIAPLEPVGGLRERAVRLREGLLDERGEDDPASRPPTCEPSRAGAGTAGRVPPGLEPPPEGSAAEAARLRRLAKRFQPELVIDRRDGFWPVPVRTLFAMRDRRAAICRQPAVAGSDCLRLGTAGTFPWAGGRGEYLEYPAADDDRDEQHDQVVAALGTADPARSALVYYIASPGTPGRKEPITIQYWFFYPFNYQPTGAISDGGYHEGDFESVSVLLSAKTNRPRYVWMARHDEEGRRFAWEDEALTKEGEHLQVFVAKGSHASYENCGRQSRPAAPHGLIDDYPSCDAGRPLYLQPETTPLVDLARVGWGCWRGLFGHASGGIYKELHLIEDAPRSPLWQDVGGIDPQPCRGIADPGGREGRDEEVLEEEQGVPAALRRRAASLAPLVDRCADWKTPAVTGTYIVACDQRALDAYFASGLEAAGQAGVRIDMARTSAPQVGDFTLPALRHNPGGSYLDGWRIVAANPTEISVFASCPRSGADRAVGAWFESVEILPGQPLRLLDRGAPGVWRLTRPDGSTAAKAVPFPTRVKGGALVEAEPKLGQVLACGPN